MSFGKVNCRIYRWKFRFTVTHQWSKMQVIYIKFILVNRLTVNEMSRLMTKPTKWPVCPAKTQISLGIRPVWSESSLCAQWVAKDPNFLYADSEDSDQTGHMPRLIWVFAGCTCPFVGFVMRWLKYWWQSRATTQNLFDIKWCIESQPRPCKKGKNRLFCPNIVCKPNCFVMAITLSHSRSCQYQYYCKIWSKSILL